MPGQDVTISTPDGDFNGYLTLPASGSGPGIVVIQEIFGINGFMREACTLLSRAGFVALCPDLFWRIEPGINLTDRTEEEMQKAFELYGKFDVDKGVGDIGATVDFLRDHSATNGKIGTVGFCLGGLLAYLSAARTSADACVGYYGVGIHEKLEEAGAISTPLILHVAAKDDFVPPEAQAQMKEGLASNDSIVIYSYAGMGHAFARTNGEHYSHSMANLANQRTRDFFHAYLD